MHYIHIHKTVLPDLNEALLCKILATLTSYMYAMPCHASRSILHFYTCTLEPQECNMCAQLQAMM